MGVVIAAKEGKISSLHSFPLSCWSGSLFQKESSVFFLHSLSVLIFTAVLFYARLSLKAGSWNLILKCTICFH